MGGKSCFSHTNPCDIQFKIYRFPNFNMLFQLVLTKFFKGELFSKLTKLIDASQIDVFDLLIKVRLFQINVHRLLTLNLLWERPDPNQQIELFSRLPKVGHVIN